MTKKIALFKCQECNKKFYTVKAAEKVRPTATWATVIPECSIDEA